jgi:hypothetical protein
VFGTPGDELRNIIGTFAEYVVAPETRIVPKPANLTFEQAAAAPQAGVTALQALRKGNAQPGMTVLINGAAGGVATFAVQIAKALGAEVTGVCSSHSVELVTSLGADHVIDYTREDFTNTGHRYDVIIDLVANRSLTACRRALSRALRASPQPSSSGTPSVSATNPERDGDRGSFKSSDLKDEPNRSHLRLTQRCGSRTFYVQWPMPTPEDLTEIERAGRRCAMCHSGRRWRQFEVARPEGQKPVVMCAACRVRYGAAPPLPATQKAAAAPVVPPQAAAPKQRTAPREDRLRKALRQLPRKPHSVGQVAKAAGLNHDKTLNRLRALQAAGEVQQVGKRWSSQPPSTDLEAAFDRLQAQTNNLRIIRDRDPVG